MTGGIWKQIDQLGTNLWSPISTFDDGDIVVEYESRIQYILSAGTLIEVSDSSDHSDKMSEVGSKMFSKVNIQTFFDEISLQRQSNKVKMSTMISNGKITLLEIIKFNELNESPDLETIQLVSNILSVKNK